VGDAVASSKRSGKSTGLLLAAAPPLTHFVTRVMLIRHWPCRGKSALPGFLIWVSSLSLGVAQLSCLWLALASPALFEPITVAVHFEDVDVVGQSVEQRTGSAARTRTRRYRARHSPWAERQRSVHKHRRLRAAGHGGLSNVRSLFETTVFAGLRKAGVPEE